MDLRHEIVTNLQWYGRQSAKQLAQRIERNEKLISRVLCDLNKDGVVTYHEVPEMRILKLKGMAIKRFQVRYYCLPIKPANTSWAYLLGR